MLIILLIIKMQIEIRMETSAANITIRIQLQLGNTSILVASNKIRNMNSDIEIIMDYNASNSVVLK